jgi:hypothetical protein
VTGNAIYLVTVWAIPVIVAITFHEAAHGFVAYLLGDDTAWRLGRASFNPAKHVDPFGTILLPGMLLLLRAPFLFGYAARRRGSVTDQANSVNVRFFRRRQFACSCFPVRKYLPRNRNQGSNDRG